MDEQLILDRYRLIERLAVGGSAEVWRAHDEQLDRPVAVKRLHPHLFADPQSRSRLAAEARAAARLSHPVIVGVYDVDATGEAPALIMELVDGESLAARLEREGPMRGREAAALVADLADALFHAHQQGVIHRDVKPANVLIGRDGRTRLVDFGIAHSLAEAAERLTLTGTVVGTLRAMAPEQLADGPITPRTDLYGLGVVLHEALTGRPPYDSSSPVVLAEAQRSGPPPLTGIDPALAAVISACLAHDPADRPLHAGALAAALRAWLAGDSEPALAMAPVPRPVDPAAATETMPVAAVQGPAPAVAAAAGLPPRRTTRKPWMPLLAAAAGALVILAILAAAGGLRTGTAVPTGMPSPSSVATPSSTPPSTPVLAAEWVAELLDDYRKECGGQGQAEVEAAISGLDEEAAEEYVDGLVEACKEAKKGRGNGNGGN